MCEHERSLALDHMDRPAKLARLEAFRRSKPSCSAWAMSAILQDIARNSLPEFSNRSAFREARNAVMDRFTPFFGNLNEKSKIDCQSNIVGDDNQRQLITHFNGQRMAWQVLSFFSYNIVPQDWKNHWKELGVNLGYHTTLATSLSSRPWPLER